MRRDVSFLLIALLIPATSCADRDTVSEPAPARTMVAIYDDAGCWSASVVALDRLYRWMGHRVVHMTAAQVQQGGLDSCGLLCVPGGDMYTYSQSLSASGIDRIQRFVRDGGAYVGVCGGAYFAAEQVVWQGNRLPMNSLALYRGSAEGPIDEIVPYPDSGMCLLRMTTRDHPILKALPDSAWVLYFWGPVLLPDPGSNVTQLAVYSAVNEPAVLAFENGRGRVFLIGVHPEIEEDSDRDGVDVGAGFDDRGSEWDLMKSATNWCLEGAAVRRRE